MSNPRAPLLPKRERTRRQLIAAATRVFAEKGVEGTAIQEIAATAGMANGTFYNYFPTKEAILQAVAAELAETLCRRISTSYAHLSDAAERMAIGNRRYVLLAAEQPETARLMLAVGAVAPHLAAQVSRYAKADLTLGQRQGRFHVPNAAVAMDLINGMVGQAMRTVLAGGAGRAHAAATATVVLRGLGLAAAEAAEIAHRPLPPLPELAPDAP